MAGRVTHLPLDSADRKAISPLYGEISVLTPKGDISRRVIQYRDKRTGELINVNGIPFDTKTQVFTGNGSTAIYGPLAKPALAVYRDEMHVFVGGVCQHYGDFVLCTNNGVEITAGQASYVKFDTVVPNGCQIVICYPIEIEFDEMAPLDAQLPETPPSGGQVAEVLTPSITVPANTDTVDIRNGSLSIVSSPFAVQDGYEDTHKSTDWKITADAAGKEIIKEVTSTTDLTTITMTGLELVNNTFYHLFVRYNGNTYGASDWSNDLTFKAVIPSA